MVVLLLLALASPNASKSLETSRDQYKAQKDKPYPPQLLSEATDKTVDVRRPLSIKSEPIKKDEVFEKIFPPTTKDLGGKLQRRKRSDNSKKAKRTIENYFNRWSPTHVNSLVDVPPLDAFSAWKPQVYQISRPYYIPVWNRPGKLPFYFPPQPIYVNAGSPQDNPPNREYLPPDNSTVVPTINKYDENPPVWGAVSTTTTVRPTRRPSRPGQSRPTIPPLLHKPGDKIPGPSTTAKIPSAIKPGAPPGKQPSRCVWATISCCQPSSGDVSYSCFEQLGCTGAFWDSTPCQSEFANAAIQNIMDYYQRN